MSVSWVNKFNSIFKEKIKVISGLIPHTHTQGHVTLRYIGEARLQPKALAVTQAWVFNG